MKFKQILASITGLSCPVFGIQWQPITTEKRLARDLLRELEDKRVLYRPEDMEGANHCVSSIINLRESLTVYMQRVETDSPLYKQIQKLRRASRAFCDIIGSPKFDAAPFPMQKSLLSRELGKLRLVAGSAIAAISISYGLDVEDELASILPFNNLP